MSAGRRALWLLSAGLFAAGSTGCSEISTPLPSQVPVMVGPVTNIGGKKRPMREDVPEDTEFDKDNESSMWVCWGTAYPTFSSTGPDTSAVMGSIGEANAAHAGRRPLRSVINRVEGVDVGSFIWFAGGCYGQGWWWSADGQAEAK